MSPRITRVLTVVGALLVLGSVNLAIQGKERVIREGETVYLELAPVDPRSLMQGDYMALRFHLAEEIEAWREATGREGPGRAPLILDGRGVATLDVDATDEVATDEGARDEDVTDEGAAAQGTSGEDAAGRLRIAFRIRNGRVWLGTNAYFFAEGTGERYESARYGEFRVDPSTGEAVLVGLRDAELNRL